MTIDTPTELKYKMIERNEKYANLVDIGKILPMATPNWSKNLP